MVLKILVNYFNKSHDTVLEINLNKLIHNFNFYRSQITNDTLLMCMVKATGYGSGSTELHLHFNIITLII